MGWDYCQWADRSALGLVEQAFGPEGRARVLDAHKTRDVVYGAYREDSGRVFAFVLAYRAQGAMVGTKPMAEWEGPFAYDCPGRILDLLTPTENTNANEWRTKCRQGGST